MTTGSTYALGDAVLVEPAASAQPRSFVDRFALLFVITGLLLANFGVWNAEIPLEDEGSYIHQSLALLRAGEFSTNLFLHAYAFLFRHVTSDPVTAHLILRFVSSVISTLGLYLVLGSFSGIRRAAVVIACLVWTASLLCTPTNQTSNVCVFTLALVLPALAYLLRRPSAVSILTFVLSAYWAAQIRPEYLAPLVMVPIGGIILIRARRRARPSETAAPDWRGRKLAALLVGALVFSRVLAAQQVPTIGVQSYLLLGLGQCYGVFYAKRHPEEVFAPMTEYKPVLDKVFGHPKTFTEAIANNPREFAHYLAVNGFSNLVSLPRLVLASKNKLYSALVLALLVVGSALGVTRLVRARRAGGQLLDRELLARLAILVCVLSASACAIVLLVPVNRYFISWVPLLYLWMAWAVNQLLGRLRWKNATLLAACAATVIFGLPTFPRHSASQAFIRSIRAAGASFSPGPIIAGAWVLPVAVFAFRDRATFISPGNGLDVDGFRARRYDLFIDDIGQTTFAVQNRDFLRRFEASPAQFGYRVLPFSSLTGTPVYARIEQPL
jgi:hypothetical protein